jgi:multidrug efflux pump subunit AcrA (membrane-fusion protein)
MTMKKTALLFLIGFLTIAISSCGKKEEAEKPKKIPTIKGIGVEVIKTSTMEDFYEAVGTVRSKITSVLSSRVTGNVLLLHVREGDPVKAGQLLLEIDDRNLHTQLRKSQAGLREAQDMVDEIERNIQAAEAYKTAAEAEQNLSLSTYNRYKALLDKKSVSQQEFDQVEARYRSRTADLERANAQIKSYLARREQALAKIEQARAEVSHAEISISYARIQSPISGVVAVKQTEVGVLATPGAPLLTVEDNAHYRLEAVVEESMIGKIRLGDLVGVVIEALGPMEWGGKVIEISPASDPGSRSLIVKIDLVSKERKGRSQAFLRSGLFGKARFLSGERTLVAIPAKAILPRGQLQGVYVVDSANIARLRLIQVGKSYGERVEVLSGLRDGERILVGGLEKVQDGCRIEW